MTARTHTAIRLSEQSLEAVDAIVMLDPETTRASVLRRLLALGLAAWQQGHRTPDTIRKAR